MKKIILLSVCLLSSFILFAQENAEKELIKKVIQDAYVDGLCNNANADAINQGFHPGFILFMKGEGKTLRKIPIYNWIEYAKKGKKMGLKYSFQNEHTTVKFLFIDVAGTIATAKIEFYEGKELKFIDYLSLIKYEDGWKIVSKIAYAIPKDQE